ncbi:hypothetical protein [Bauldia litoralis]|uniref:Uncharacterized protein n=1 Tax=Bauldia litoralis TaxID=665467 RepID=A0A1G6D3X8_9HYPH|nr:hypothetical protein [Bauldia litoralis]SDB39874.1 hypothetical protein SAMN02982931_02982 [Bauldia litoralis]
MASTLSTLREVQVERTIAVPGMAEPPPVSASLEGIRRRNAALDALFYDVSVVTLDEARTISPWLAREGSILHVPPTGKGDLTLCATPDDLAGVGAVSSLAVAGVGSSALGSAAFARNIADATGEPVAVVVSGYGLSDLVSEAMGGWFLFGAANRTRMVERLVSEMKAPTASDLGATELRRSSKDTATVIALLSDPRFDFTLLTGHSKGNLVVAEALYALIEVGEGKLPIPADTRIVTVSAAIEMPRGFSRITDVIGAWDWFGGLNSSNVTIDVLVPHAWHHTNREVPFHLPVTETFARLLAG